MKWWESEPNNDNKIIILGSCEWFSNLEGTPLFMAVSSSMDVKCFQTTSPITLGKPQYHQISTLWTLKSWESEPKDDNKIII